MSSRGFECEYKRLLQQVKIEHIGTSSKIRGNKIVHTHPLFNKHKITEQNTCTRLLYKVDILHTKTHEFFI